MAEILVIRVPLGLTGYCTACGFLPAVWGNPALAAWDTIGHATAHHRYAPPVKATIDHWTCDRCETKAETPPGTQPAGWTGMDRTTLPLAQPQNGARRHLCPSCSAILDETLAKPTDPPGDTDD